MIGGLVNKGGKFSDTQEEISCVRQIFFQTSLPVSKFEEVLHDLF